MKNILLISLIFIIPGSLQAQSPAIQDFHDRYKENGKYVSVRIEGGLLKFLTNVDTNDENAKDLMKAISGLESITFHSIDRDEPDFDDNYLKKFKKSIQKDKYEELMIVRDGDTLVDFLIKEKNGKISDLLLMVNNIDEFFLLNFSGEIDLATLSKLSDELDIKGAKHLRKIEDD